jgi:radical SAM protein with 4Fe4S-binding SPASM domain
LPEEIRWRRIPKRTEQEALHCPQPWYAMTIWVDGLVSPCCAFTGKNVAVGNIHTQSLKEIWRGEKINELRDQFRTGELNMICRKCLADYLPKKNGG